MTSREQRVERLNSQRELSQMIIHGEDPVPERLHAINKIWNEQEEMIAESGSVYTMQEVILDLDVLRTTGSAFGKSIKSVKANTDAFTLPEFAAKFNTRFSNNHRFDWEAVADAAAPIINRAPGLSLMLGTFKPNAPFVMPEKRKRPSRTKDELSQKQKPENVEMVEKNNDGIDVKVNFLIKVLKECYKRNGNNPVPLYNFILHPKNFTTTVENIFYLSFVIRDGLAQIEVIDEDMVISPMERTDNSSSSKMEKKQMIFSITKEKWESVVRERNIKTPAINWEKRG